MATVIVVVMTMARTMNINVSMIRILSMIIVMLVISLRVHFQACSYTLMLGNPHTSRHFMHIPSLHAQGVCQPYDRKGALFW